MLTIVEHENVNTQTAEGAERNPWAESSLVSKYNLKAGSSLKYVNPKFQDIDLEE